MKLSFRERAQRLGHSLELLNAGMPVTTFITVKDIDQLKAITNVFLDRDNNPDLGKHLFGNIQLTDARHDHSAAGTLRRVNEFIYGNAELHPMDRERIRGAFPMQIQATSAENFTPTEPVRINSPIIPQVYNYGTVTLNQGIYINIYNTVINGFTMDTLVRNGDNGNPDIGDINIFGATGSTSSTNGSTGATGTQGSKGSGGTCTVSGSEPGDNGGKGGTGTAGATGGAGDGGGPGLASYQAIFTINDSIEVNGGNAVLFFTRSGTGGSGSNGGAGGRGGTGGQGGDGKTCECTGTSGGNGGNGGAGGSGGRGGDAGNGVNAAGNIVVTVPSATFINKGSASAPPGAFGQGGAPGSGGVGGSGGSGGKGHSDGSNGTQGPTGSHGNPGNASQVSGTPATITINVV